MAKAKARPTVKLREGARGLGRDANEPVITFAGGRGRSMYLWIGNDAPSDKWCYATLSSAATLRKLAKAILAEVGNG